MPQKLRCGCARHSGPSSLPSRGRIPPDVGDPLTVRVRLWRRTGTGRVIDVWLRRGDRGWFADPPPDPRGKRASQRLGLVGRLGVGPPLDSQRIAVVELELPERAPIVVAIADLDDLQP